MEQAKSVLIAIGVGLLALVAGVLANMGIVNAGAEMWPVDPQFNLKTMAGLEAALPTFTTVQLLYPVLAHAVGTLVSALIVARVFCIPVCRALFLGRSANGDRPTCSAVDGGLGPDGGLFPHGMAGPARAAASGITTLQPRSRLVAL